MSILGSAQTKQTGIEQKQFVTTFICTPPTRFQAESHPKTPCDYTAHSCSTVPKHGYAVRRCLQNASYVQCSLNDWRKTNRIAIIMLHFRI